MDRRYDKLAASLTLLMGIDPVVVMTDVAGVSRKRAFDSLEWTARTLVDSGLHTASGSRAA